MSGRSAATHRDAGAMKLLADRGPVDAQLCADLAQGPTLGVQLRRTIDVYGVTVATTRLVVAPSLRSRLTARRRCSRRIDGHHLPSSVDRCQR